MRTDVIHGREFTGTVLATGGAALAGITIDRFFMRLSFPTPALVCSGHVNVNVSYRQYRRRCRQCCLVAQPLREARVQWKYIYASEIQYCQTFSFVLFSLFSRPRAGLATV